jgi:hypothetical protein
MAVHAKPASFLTFIPADFALSVLISVLRKVDRLTDLLAVTVQALRGGFVNYNSIADLFIVFDMVN